MNAEKRKSNLFSWSLLLIIIGVVVLLNIIGAFLYARVDMTEDERFSLNRGTIEFLEKIGNHNDNLKNQNEKKINRIYIKIYLSGALPAELKRFKNAIEDKLQEFRQIAGDRIEYEFIDPSVGSDADKKALGIRLYNNAKGIMPMEILYEKDGTLSQQLLWPGAEIDYGGVTKGYIQFLPGTPNGKPIQLSRDFSETTIQNSINNLEYMMVTGIRRVIQTEKPRIAFIQGHGELRFPETMRVRKLLEDYYTVEDIYLNDSISALDNVKGVVIARPRTPYTDKDLFILDQFVMKGGRLMCFFDKLTFPVDTLMMRGTVHTTRTNLGIDKLLYDYGINVHDNYAMDVRCGKIIMPYAQLSLENWFYYLAASPTKHPISRNIEPVMLRYASQIDFTLNEDWVVSPILTTSSNSTVSPTAPLISLGLPRNYGRNPVLAPDPTFEGNKICVAGMVEGKFVSHYKNRIIDAYAKNKDARFEEKSVREGKVLVVGNGSFIANYYDSMPNKEGKMQYRPIAFNNLKVDEVSAQARQEPLFIGNQEFFQNIVDYMMDDNSVLDIRSKQIDIHPIDKEKVKENGTMYQLLNMMVPSALVLLLAAIIFILRKRKYARS